MTDPVLAEPATVPLRRPRAVVAAVAALLVTAALDIIAAGVSLPAYQALGRNFEPALVDAGMAATEATRTASLAQNTLLVTLIVSVVIGLAVLLLAWFVHRGSAVARVVAMVVCIGVTVCLAGATALNAVSFDSAVDTVEVMSASYPSWYLSANQALAAAQVVGYVAVVVLLALPASARFFRPGTDPDIGWIHHPTR